MHNKHSSDEEKSDVPFEIGLHYLIIGFIIGLLSMVVTIMDYTDYVLMASDKFRSCKIEIKKFFFVVMPFGLILMVSFVVLAPLFTYINIFIRPYYKSEARWIMLKLCKYTIVPTFIFSSVIQYIAYQNASARAIESYSDGIGFRSKDVFVFCREGAVATVELAEAALAAIHRDH